MAEPLKRTNLDYERSLAAISLAGVRPLVQSTIAPGAAAAVSYTITHASAHRVVLFHASGTDTDLRVEVNGTALATDMPIISGAYFVLEIKKDDYVSVYNTTGGAITINIMEIS